jgi:hypothetical protein
MGCLILQYLISDQDQDVDHLAVLHGDDDRAERRRNFDRLKTFETFLPTFIIVSAESKDTL